MKIIDVVQGSDEWLALRMQHDCASEAPVMMAASSKMKRNELLRIKATGLQREYSDFVQDVLFAKGHAAEAAIRPYIESILGEDLYPTTGAEGRMLSSFDGVTMDERVIFEHKLWNESLAAAARAGRLEPEYYWQLEHQLATSGAEKVIFVVSDGTPEKCVHMYYEPVPGRAGQLARGWAQFNEDAANWTAAPAEVIVTAAVTESLPAVSVRMDGAIAVISNLDIFGAKLQAFIDGIDKNPSTDQAFADAEAAVKTLQTAQDALEQAEAAALAQTSSIDDMRRTVKMYADMARTTRLALGKIVTQRKEQIRVEIQQAGAQAFADHVAAINKRLGKVQLPAITANFALVMKGKKTLSSLRGAVDDELARVKIEANAIAEKIDANLRSLRELGGEFPHLFHDAQTICQKANDDLVALVKLRVAEHKAAEQAKADQIAADARQKLLDEQAAQKAIDDAKPAPAVELAAGQAPHVLGAVLADALAVPVADLEPSYGGASGRFIGGSSAESHGEFARIGAPMAADNSTIKLGDINARIAPLSISAEGLAQLGYRHVATDKAAKLYRASDLPAILNSMVQMLQRVSAGGVRKAA